MKAKPKCQHRSCPPDRCEKKTSFIFLLLMIAMTIVLAAVTPGYAHTASVSAIRPLSDSRLMPETTIRQQIVDKLKLRLARISIANGFQTDIGATEAEEWPTNYNEGQLREQTRLGIFDRDTDTTQNFAREKQVGNVLPFQVRIYHKRETTPAQLRLMLADVMKAISENEVTGDRDPQWRTFDTETNKYLPKNLALDTKPLRDGFVIPTDVFGVDAGAVEFHVEFLSEPFNAYE